MVGELVLHVSTFPVDRINRVAAASCLIWSVVTLAVHLCSLFVWRGYSKALRPSDRRQWCNKIACGLHAAVLAYHQAWNLFDPVLNADPLHGVTDSHFFWASVLLGYLVYDTAYSLAFFPLRSGAVMLAHHLVGIAGCVIGVYFNKLALFGMAVEVFFESCNPLLHVLGCMRIAGRSQGSTYRLVSDVFLAQFFLFRVVISNCYFLWMLHIVLRQAEQPWWAWAGVAVFGLLNTLNVLWVGKLVQLRARDCKRFKQQQQLLQQGASDGHECTLQGPQQGGSSQRPSALQNGKPAVADKGRGSVKRPSAPQSVQPAAAGADKGSGLGQLHQRVSHNVSLSATPMRWG